MTPSAVATLLDSLADAIATGFPAHVSREKYLAEIAAALYTVPLCHPLRMVPVERPDDEGRPVQVTWDAVFDMARAIQRGKATPDELRAFAGKLRDGEAEMKRTGWGWML